MVGEYRLLLRPDIILWSIVAPEKPDEFLGKRQLTNCWVQVIRCTPKRFDVIPVLPPWVKSVQPQSRLVCENRLRVPTAAQLRELRSRTLGGAHLAHMTAFTLKYGPAIWPHWRLPLTALFGAPKAALHYLHEQYVVGTRYTWHSTDEVRAAITGALAAYVQTDVPDLFRGLLRSFSYECLLDALNEAEECTQNQNQNL